MVVLWRGLLSYLIQSSGDNELAVAVFQSPLNMSSIEFGFYDSLQSWAEEQRNNFFELLFNDSSAFRHFIAPYAIMHNARSTM